VFLTQAPDGSTARIDLAGERRVPVLDEAALDALAEALETAGANGVRCLVLTGGRSGTFAAGADLRRLAGLDPLEAMRFSRHGQRILDQLEVYPGGTIAAIDGQCVGGAFDLAMACDLRLVTPRTVFRHPGPTLGFITGYGGTRRLPDLVGPGSSFGPLTGMTSLGARQAYSLGLATSIVPEEDLESESSAMARRIAQTPPGRLRVVKRALLTLGRSGSTIRRGLLMESLLAAEHR